VLGIISQPTPRTNVVHLEIRQTSAALTAPAIPLQYLLTQLSVGTRIKS